MVITKKCLIWDPSILTRGVNKYGVLIKGRKNTQATYDSILYISNKYIIIKISEKFGVIDTAGAIIIPFEYTDILKSDPNFALKKDSCWYYYQNLKMLFISKFQPVTLHKNKLIFKAGYYYNYFDDTGHIVLPVNYKWISFKSCLAIASNDRLIFLNSKNQEFVYYNYLNNK